MYLEKTCVYTAQQISLNETNHHPSSSVTWQEAKDKLITDNSLENIPLLHHSITVLSTRVTWCVIPKNFAYDCLTDEQISRTSTQSKNRLPGILIWGEKTEARGVLHWQGAVILLNLMKCQQKEKWIVWKRQVTCIGNQTRDFLRRALVMRSPRFVMTAVFFKNWNCN